MDKGKFLIISLFFLVVISFSCSKKNIDQSVLKSVTSDQELERDYNYAFTEATKQALLNNFSNAISIYNKCISAYPGNSAPYFQLSNIYMRVGNMNYAKEYALKAFSLDKENKWYLYHLASLYQMNNQLDSALIYFEKVVDIDIDNYEAKLNLVILYITVNKNKKALDYLNKIENDIGVNEKTILLKFEILNSLKKVNEAIIVAENGIKQYPENIDIIGVLAEKYTGLGEFEKAESYYKKLFTIDSTNLKITLSYCKYLLEYKNYEKFLQLYSAIFEDISFDYNFKFNLVFDLYRDDKIFKNIIKPLNELIVILKKDTANYEKTLSLSADINLKAGDYDSAIEDLKYLLKIENENQKIWEQIIYIENFIGNYDSVIYYTEMAEKLFNKNVIFNLMKGNALIQKEEFNLAIKVLSDTQNIRDINDKVQLFGLLGECYNSIRDFEKSDIFFKKAMNLDTQNMYLKNNYSYYLSLREEKLDEAKKLSEITIINEPTNSTFLDTYAWVLYKKGELKKSLKYIKKAIEYGGSNDFDILDHYGDILYKLNHFNEALIIWQKARSIKSDNDKIEKKINEVQKNL